MLSVIKENWPVIWQVGVVLILFAIALAALGLGVGTIFYLAAREVKPVSFSSAWLGGTVFTVFFYLVVAVVIIRRGRGREEIDCG